MRIVVGIAAALAVALGITGWLLKAAWKDAQEARIAAQTAERQARDMSARFDALDAAMASLGRKTAIHQKQLDETLKGISTITKTEQDDEKTMECLDVPVPRQLDQRMRHQP